MDNGEEVYAFNERRLAVRENGNHNNYQQIVIWNADHYYSGLEQDLLVRVKRWLDDILHGKKINFRIEYSMHLNKSGATLGLEYGLLKILLSHHF